MENFKKKIKLLLLLFFPIFIFTIIFNSDNLYSDSIEDINIIDQVATSEFPKGIKFNLNFNSKKTIEDIKLVMNIGNRSVSQYSYMVFSSSKNQIVSEYFHNAGNINNYIPPSTNITYFYEFIFDDKSSYISEDFSFFYHDKRFNWQETNTENSNVFFYDIPLDLAKEISNISDQTINDMSRLLNVNIYSAINLVIYNNKNEMDSAVIHKSKTSSEKLIVLGQAFSDEGVVIVLLDEQILETVVHEITHIVSSIATDGSEFLPLWLNEGLSEYSDEFPDKYKSILRWGIEEKNLMPFKHLNTFPGDPEKTILAYGQSQSVVRFLINNYGQKNFSELFQQIRFIKSYPEVNDVFTKIYGFNLDELYISWEADLYNDLGIVSEKNNKSFFDKFFIKNNYYLVLFFLFALLIFIFIIKKVKKI